MKLWNNCIRILKQKRKQCSFACWKHSFFQLYMYNTLSWTRKAVTFVLSDLRNFCLLHNHSPKIIFVWRLHLQSNKCIFKILIAESKYQDFNRCIKQTILLALKQFPRLPLNIYYECREARIENTLYSKSFHVLQWKSEVEFNVQASPHLNRIHIYCRMSKKQLVYSFYTSYSKETSKCCMIMTICCTLL